MTSLSMTCLACNVVFEDIDLGRNHYKTDWHRYNLKRKVAELTPVTFEKFQDRLQQQEKQELESANSQESCCCKPCQKVFSSSNAYENHLQSKKHKDVLSGKEKKKKKTKGKKQQTAQKPQQRKVIKSTSVDDEDETMMSDDDDVSDADSMDSYDENCLGIEECLFCSFQSPSMEENISHMTLQHGFFLPDLEYISDLEAFISYLGEKVGAGRVCLWCNEKGKRFHNTKDVQKHMVDKGHCKLLHEGEAVFEYADYYDYTTSYPDADNHDTKSDDIVNLEELESDGYSLTLPSGAQIGHRSLVRYYQQNLVPHTKDGTKKVLPRVLAQYKALGWTGCTGTQVEKRVKDIRFMKTMRARYHMQLGVKNNFNNRAHFRNPNGPLC